VDGVRMQCLAAAARCSAARKAAQIRGLWPTETLTAAQFLARIIRDDLRASRITIGGPTSIVPPRSLSFISPDGGSVARGNLTGGIRH